MEEEAELEQNKDVESEKDTEFEEVLKYLNQFEGKDNIALGDFRFVFCDLGS